MLGTPIPRPPSVSAATGTLIAAFVLRLFMWCRAVNWSSLPTYSSFAYVGPFTLVLIWAAYRGNNWARLWLTGLFGVTLFTWSVAMASPDHTTSGNAWARFCCLKPPLLY